MSSDYYGSLAGELADYGDEICDSCTCCTVAGCIPSQCGEDDYGRFHCPCTCE